MSTIITLCELLVLGNISENGKISRLASEIVDGEYITVLNQIVSEENVKFLSTNGKDYIKEIEEFVERGDSDNVLLLAINCLQLYLQSNFTGPSVALADVSNTISKDISHDDAKVKDFFNSCVNCLVSDGEPPFKLMSYPHLLLLSLTVLSKLKKNPFASWWYSRALIIHQSVVYNPTASIHDQVTESLNKDTLKDILQLLQDERLDDEASNKLVSNLEIRFYIESARAQMVYGHDSLAKEYIEKAKDASKLEWLLTGIRAKRTKFQKFDTSQLVFLAKSNDTTTVNDITDSADRALDLNSDLLLEKPHYNQLDDSNLPERLKSLDPNNQPALLDIDTSIILLHVEAIRSSTPHSDILIQEELLATVNRIINSPQSSVNWTLFSSALWNRSLLEANSAKTVERGTLQMQSLVEELGQSTAVYLPKGISDSTTPKEVSKRLLFIHQLNPLPKWSMDTALAEKFMSLGVLKSAIEVYERLELWGEVALCYTAVGQVEEGVKVLKDYLETHADDYRCISILGDITLDPELWEKAWQIGKYPAAKRSLGKFYYNPPASSGVERNLDLSIRHLNDSLRINPLNLSAWFLYGCAGLETSQWELAAEAFTRCVAIEEDDPKSWSNLATALLRLDKKHEAFNALKRASRTATEKQDWRIWSNYVTVAGELREWNEVVRGLKQLISLRSDKEGEKCLEIDLLESLLQILLEGELIDINDEKLESRANYYFQNSCIDLFTNIIPSLITSNPRLWKLVSRVHIWLRKPWAALEDYEKGFRIYTHTPLLQSDEEVWNEAVEYCIDLVDAYSNFGPMEGKYGEGNLVCKDWKFKARSCIRLLMGKGKVWEDGKGWERLIEAKEGL